MTVRIITIVVPTGYKDGAEFAKDCGFELAPETPHEIVNELRDQANRLTAGAYNPSEARSLRVEWRAADEIERLLAQLGGP